VLKQFDERHQADQHHQRRQQVGRRAEGDKSQVREFCPQATDQIVNLRIRLGGVEGDVVLVEGELCQEQQHGTGQQHESPHAAFATRGRLICFRIILSGHGRRLGKRAAKGQSKTWQHGLKLGRAFDLVPVRPTQELPGRRCWPTLNAGRHSRALPVAVRDQTHAAIVRPGQGCGWDAW
jgi:hypothetical protein